LYQAIDGRIWYFPEITNRWSTYGSEDTSDWYAIDFGKLEEFSTVKLYFYADSKKFAAPDNYKAETWNGNKWVDIKDQKRSPIVPTGNSVNKVSFRKISASKVRVIFINANKNHATALTEIEIF